MASLHDIESQSVKKERIQQMSLIQKSMYYCISNLFHNIIFDVSLLKVTEPNKRNYCAEISILRHHSDVHHHILHNHFSVKVMLPQSHYNSDYGWK